MTDLRHLCPCGKPIHDGAHLCHECIGQLRRDLRTIADRWDDLEAALTAAENAPVYLVDQHAGDNTGNATGIRLNEQVSAARRDIGNLAWFIVQVLRDDYDTAGKEFRAPRHASIPSMLRWIEEAHVRHLMHDGAEETALEIADDARKAHRSMERALSAVRTIYTGLPCVEHDTSEDGERVQCIGQMKATIVPGVAPDLVCTMDPSHRLDPASWLREGWLGRISHEAGARRLAERLAP